MRDVRLRHHHLLCTRTFNGRGYDYRFVANMEEVVSKLGGSEDLTVHLAMENDDICSSCPNEVKGLCRDHEEVLEKDRSAALFLGLPERASAPAGPLMGLVEERMGQLDDIRLICGECQWSELCNQRLREMKG